MEVNAPKAEQAIREAMVAGEAEEKVGQEQDEAVDETEELAEAKEFEEEEAASYGWEISMAM